VRSSAPEGGKLVRISPAWGGKLVGANIRALEIQGAISRENGAGGTITWAIDGGACGTKTMLPEAPTAEQAMVPEAPTADGSPLSPSRSSRGNVGRSTPSGDQVPRSGGLAALVSRLEEIVGKESIKIEEGENGIVGVSTILWLQEGEDGRRLPHLIEWSWCGGLFVEIKSGKRRSPRWSWEDILDLRSSLCARLEVGLDALPVSEVLGELSRAFRLFAKQIDHPAGWIRTIAPDLICGSDLPWLEKPSWSHPNRLRTGKRREAQGRTDAAGHEPEALNAYLARMEAGAARRAWEQDHYGVMAYEAEGGS
jgi:hypothetical protein